MVKATIVWHTPQAFYATMWCWISGCLVVWPVSSVKTILTYTSTWWRGLAADTGVSQHDAEFLHHRHSSEHSNWIWTERCHVEAESADQNDAPHLHSVPWWPHVWSSSSLQCLGSQNIITNTCQGDNVLVLINITPKTCTTFVDSCL